jgi:hypothetical protein
MTTETKPTDFGTGDSGRTVPASKLEPGVRVEGYFFGFATTGVVQSVTEAYAGKNQPRVRVEVANFDTGDSVVRFMYPDRPVTVWGRI